MTEQERAIAERLEAEEMFRAFLAEEMETDELLRTFLYAKLEEN